jgi:hypothetical protein
MAATKKEIVHLQPGVIIYCGGGTHPFREGAVPVPPDHVAALAKIGHIITDADFQAAQAKVAKLAADEGIAARAEAVVEADELARSSAH